MAYILVTIALWAIFALVVPFSKWRDYYPTLLATALLGTLCDLLGVTFDQWIYYGPTVGHLSLWSDLGIAPAEGGLFVRFFPKQLSHVYQVIYIVGWSLLNALFEWFFVWMGWIGYDHWSVLRAFIFYILFFLVIWWQESWYNGTGRIQTNKNQL